MTTAQKGNTRKIRIISITTMLVLLMALSILVSCKPATDDTSKDTINSTPIQEIPDRNVNTANDTSPDEETNGDADLFNEGVKKIVDKARAINNWKYRVSEGNIPFEVTICGDTMKIKKDRGSSYDNRDPTVFVLNTGENKNVVGYSCDQSDKCASVAANSTPAYESVYVKTPLDYLNEESFFSAVVSIYTKQINGRNVAPLDIEGEQVKKRYWFDTWEKGGQLVEIETIDTATGQTLATKEFNLIESNPKNIRAIDCQVTVSS